MHTAHYATSKRWSHGTISVVVEAVRGYGLITSTDPDLRAAYGYVKSHAKIKAPTFVHFREYVTALRQAREESRQEIKHGHQKLLTPVKSNLMGHRPSISTRPRLEEDLGHNGRGPAVRGIDLSRTNSPFPHSREKH